ncbi:glycosyltransferase [Rhizobium ruizarguesonis]|uniref:glycosyltransferase n=1 Tax=Rhizobium ruizarguesonis TaxID=2081791 RepID=UPI0038574B36
MPGVDSGRMMTATVVEALARQGKRGILALGGGALTAEHKSGHVHVIRDAPHDRLFRDVSAIIHHGGAGTTAAALRAGKPMIICPFFGDQPFWARRAMDLCVGLSLDRRALTPLRTGFSHSLDARERRPAPAPAPARALSRAKPAGSGAMGGREKYIACQDRCLAFQARVSRYKIDCESKRSRGGRSRHAV